MGYHLPHTTYHQLHTTNYLPPTTNHLPPTTYHIPHNTYHIASITYIPTTNHLSPTTYHQPPTNLPPTTYLLSQYQCLLIHIDDAKRCNPQHPINVHNNASLVEKYNNANMFT